MKSDSEDGRDERRDENESGGRREDERGRDRARRSDRPSRFSSASASGRERSPREGGGSGKKGSGGSGRGGRGGKRGSNDRRIFVSNIAYEYRWQDLKDLLRKEVGEVSFVELFTDENNKPRGCGIVEFDTNELAKKAVQKLHRFELKGRKLVVKEDFNVERDKQGHPIGVGGGGGGRSDSRGPPPSRGRDDHPSWSNNGSVGGPQNNSVGGQNKWGNTYGLSPKFLESLWIQAPLVSRVFIANLDYKADQKKLKEVFKLAGKVVRCELSTDKDGKSRGFGIVEYEHPVEAVQAISMLHNQVLFDRKLTVRLDRADKPDGPPKLPEGLKGIGMGLGSNGQPLQDVSRNLPSLTFNNTIGGPGQVTIGGGAALAAAAALGPTAAALGGGGGQMGVAGPLGLGGAGVSLAGVGVDRFLDGSGGRAQSLGAGLGTSVLGGGGAGDPMGLGVGSAAAFGASLNTSNFNQRAQTTFSGAQAGFLSANTGGGGSGGRDFDSLSASLTGGYSGAQVMDGRQQQPQVDHYRQQGGGGGGGRGVGLDGGGAGGGPNTNTTSDSVIIRNMPNVSWQHLKDKFSEAGEVKYAEVRGKDTGLVQYTSQWDANRAVNMFDRTRWDGRSLDVRQF